MVCQTYPPTTFQVCGVIRDKYNQMGGPTSFLLYPKSNELTNPGNTGKRSEFVGGNIYWSAATGAHPVAHDFLAKWGEKGYETGFLKYPTTDEIVLSDNVSRRQEFQGGSIYWSPFTGAHSIQGSIRQKWLDLGADQSYLRFPSTDEVVTPDGAGRFNRFQNGSIYWAATTGAHPVAGRILEVWAASGYETSPYGYPIEDAVPVASEAGAYTQKFQFGSIYARGDQSFRGIIVPADTQFNTYDTNLHPGYNDHVDLSDYDTVADPGGSQKTANRLASAAVEAYFSDQPRSLALWQHYYDNLAGGSHPGPRPSVATSDSESRPRVRNSRRPVRRRSRRVLRAVRVRRIHSRLTPVTTRSRLLPSIEQKLGLADIVARRLPRQTHRLYHPERIHRPRGKTTSDVDHDRPQCVIALGVAGARTHRKPAIEHIFVSSR